MSLEVSPPVLFVTTFIPACLFPSKTNLFNVFLRFKLQFHMISRAQSILYATLPIRSSFMSCRVVSSINSEKHFLRSRRTLNSASVLCRGLKTH